MTQKKTQGQLKITSKTLPLTNELQWLQERTGWPEARLLKAANEYRSFLRAHVKNPDRELRPESNDADEVWHAHVLHTRNYERDCKRLFGYFLHHCPKEPEADSNSEVHCGCCIGLCES